MDAKTKSSASNQTKKHRTVQPKGRKKQPGHLKHARKAKEDKMAAGKEAKPGKSVAETKENLTAAEWKISSTKSPASTQSKI